MTRPIEVFRTVNKIPGAISMTEAVALYDTIRSALKSFSGIAADMGSHAGKSSIIGAKALADSGFENDFYMVDLAYDLENAEWETTVQGSADLMPWGYLRNGNEAVEQRAKEVYKNISLLGLSSLQFLADFDELSYAFIDTDDHQPELVMKEVKAIEDIVLPGGLVFFHDYNNQYKGPRMGYRYLVKTRKYEAIEINWKSAKSYADENDLEVDNDSWHMPGVSFPCFIGCVRRK